jgi:putative peptidoglycan lipid II flippase
MIGAAWLGAPWFKTMGIEPIYAMAGGVMAGGVLQLLVQVLALRRIGLVPRVGLSWLRLMAAWNDPGTREVGRMMAPACWGWWRSRCWPPASTPTRTPGRRSRSRSWCWSPRSC